MVFLEKKIDTNEDPELLTMGPHIYYVLGSQTPDSRGFRPLKAAKRDKWLVVRESAYEAFTNFLLTRNFKKFTTLTNIQPKDKYNWLTTELFIFKQLDGIYSQAVLYKPENFDSTKKYPVIFHYYQKMSQNLYRFSDVEFANSAINIAWFVSRGYLVCTPDIYHTPGKIGVLNSVEGARRYLLKMPWVDSLRMGIAGQSFGGYFTQYLVTNTTLFSAAIATSGIK